VTRARLARLSLVCALGWALAATPAAAHEVRPAYLELRERDALHWDVLFKVPARDELRLALHVRLPEGCSGGAPARPAQGGWHVERWLASCSEPLAGRDVALEGLPMTRTDALARVERADGSRQTVRLTGDAPAFTVAAREPFARVARTYFGLGVEHILLGADHLLFVLALLFLVGSAAPLVATVTAFTLAHSLTLAAATLGLVRVPQAPVEATIALSVVFVAAEVLHARAGRPALAARKPWLAAFAFGLLHGLGFAGALREIGLPEDALPAALAFFNLGVEAGQLVFVGAVLALLAAARRLLPGRAGAADAFGFAAGLARPAAYGIGVAASYWLIERATAFFG
jgi:hypothetical protein